MEISHIASAVLGPLALVAVSLLPLPVQFAVKAIGGELHIRNVRDFALNAVKGAAKGKVLEFDLGNATLNLTVQRALDVGPAWLVKWLGGSEGIRAKVFRALDLDPALSARDMGVALPDEASAGWTVARAEMSDWLEFNGGGRHDQAKDRLSRSPQGVPTSLPQARCNLNGFRSSKL